MEVYGEGRSAILNFSTMVSVITEIMITHGMQLHILEITLEQAVIIYFW